MNEFRSQIFGDRKPLLGTKQRKSSTGQSALTDLAVKREEVRTTDTRDDDRHRLASQGILCIYQGRRSQAELVNLSGGGAMIAASLNPNLAERIDLEFADGSQIEALVRWVKNGRIGLEFAHETRIECSPEQHAALLHETIIRNFPDLEAGVAASAAAVQPEPQEPKTEAAPESRRADDRHPLIWSGTIRLYGREIVVRLRNISPHGALIQSDLTLSPGVSLELDIGGAGSVQAKVTWAAGDQAGLAFESEFDILRLSLSRPTVVPFEWDCPTYLRNAAKPSPWEKIWERLSVEDLAKSLDGYLKR